jgi:transposase
MVIVAIESHQGAIDMQVTTIGLDIAKDVFQVHGIDAAEKVVVRKQLRRSQVLEFFKALPVVPYRHGRVRHRSSRAADCILKAA